MDEYYHRVKHHREHLDDKAKIGKIGIMARTRNKGSDDIYFYWGEFKRNRSINQLATGEKTHFTKMFKKGGGKTFTYKLSIFKKVAEDWEMELIKEFEPKLAKYREATKKLRAIRRLQIKAMPLVQKVLCEATE